MEPRLDRDEQAVRAPLAASEHEVVLLRRRVAELEEKLAAVEPRLAQQAEQDLVRFFELSLDLFCFANLDGFFLRVNANFSRLLGYPDEEFLSRPFLDFVHPEDIAATRDAMANLSSGLPVVQFRNRYRAVHGQYFWIEWTARSIPEEDTIFAVARDVTERVRLENELVARKEREQAILLEQKLQEAQKLESLGVLAGGIAHDFNNLLTAILGNASLIGTEVPDDSPIQPSLEQIVQASQRAADLCRQMLAYSGRGRFVLVELDLNQVVRELLGLLKLSISKKAVLRLDLAEQLPALLADATQIRQVVMNLVLNASEALGDRSGLIRVATGLQCVEGVYPSPCDPTPDLAAGEYVFLEVSDTGCGMSEETRRKVFDPFFTTKFTGRGLGLAAVQGIVRGNKGAIKVESQLGQGTTFRLLLPPGRDGVKKRSAEALTRAPWRGEGLVLVADDEDWVRDLTARMLRSLGFRVIQAADGEEALARFQESPDEFCLVLLDLTMPKLDGEETFRTLRLLRPQLPVLLMSGFSEHEAVGRFAGQGLAGFLAKPFTLEALTLRVRVACEAVPSLTPRETPR